MAEAEVRLDLRDEVADAEAAGALMRGLEAEAPFLSAAQENERVADRVLVGAPVEGVMPGIGQRAFLENRESLLVVIERVLEIRLVAVDGAEQAEAAVDAQRILEQAALVEREAREAQRLLVLVAMREDLRETVRRHSNDVVIQAAEEHLAQALLGGRVLVALHVDHGEVHLRLVHDV